jgi:hypothetical protein
VKRLAAFFLLAVLAAGGPAMGATHTTNESDAQRAAQRHNRKQSHKDMKRVKRQRRKVTRSEAKAMKAARNQHSAAH